MNNLRSHIKEQLDKMMPNVESRSIATALLIGKEDNYIDEELMQSYVTAGVVHIIVVSGLHIGFFAFMVGLLLKPLNKRKNKFASAISLVITLGCIWIFSIIAGLGVSVLRAAIMFSFIQLNQLLYHKQNPFQVLAFSAFVILMISPYELWSIGFIFSFLALTGIFLLSDKIKEISQCLPANYLLRNVFTLVATSIAANVFIAPAAAYLFGTFYPYFIITNIIAIPLSAFILPLEVMGLLFSGIPSIAMVFNKIIYGAIWLLNYCVRAVAHIPGSSLSVHFSLAEMWLMCGSVFFIIYFILMRKKVYLYVSFLLIMAYIISGIYMERKMHEQRGFIICNFNKKCMPIVLVAGKQVAMYIKDSSFLHQKSFIIMKKNLSQFLRQDSLNVVMISPNTDLQMYTLGDMRIAHVLSHMAFKQDSSAIARANYIIIEENESTNASNIPFSHATIIKYKYNDASTPTPNVYELSKNGGLVKLWQK